MLRFQHDGDRTALARLIERNGGELLRFLVRLSRNRTIAEDVAQQTWVKVMDVAHQGTFAAASGVAFRTWLCTLARNHFIDEYQRKFAAARTVPLPVDLGNVLAEVHRVAPDPAEPLDARQRSVQLRQALLRLPFEQRQVVALWADGMRIGAIAALTAAPRDTVLSRKKYALAKLRVLMRAELPATAGSALR
ncbi:MAG TPA: sigma-70 family RNA polymerase sigma factor [Steroidobacteraceae bacterium]|nr:sigma-70 family RNA polymerase sigma factor [Steroidobacteraceae bacterium]